MYSVISEQKNLLDDYTLTMEQRVGWFKSCLLWIVEKRVCRQKHSDL